MEPDNREQRVNNEQVVELELRDRQASEYEALVMQRGRMWWKVALETAFRYLRLKDGDTVCDAGAGVGIYTRRILELYPRCHVYAVDFSQESLNVLEREVVDPKRVTTICGDLTTMKLPEQVDAVLSCEVIQCIPTHELQMEALRRIYEALKPGGRAVIFLARWSERLQRRKNMQKVYDEREQPGGYFRMKYVAEEVEQMMKDAGFVNLKIGGSVNISNRYLSHLPPWMSFVDVMISSFPFSKRLGVGILVRGEKKG